jgi:hypothetical protein
MVLVTVTLNSLFNLKEIKRRRQITVPVVRTHALKTRKEISQLYMTNVTVFKFFELTLEVI